MAKNPYRIRIFIAELAENISSTLRPQIWCCVADFAYVYKHECGGDAFYMTHKPEYAEVLNDCWHLDGTAYKKGEVIKCDTCGEKVKPKSANVIARG